MLFELPALLVGWPPLWLTAGVILTISILFTIAQTFSAPAFVLSGKHVIVTGALGEVPRRVARMLLQKGVHITLVAHAPVDVLHHFALELSEHRQCAQQQVRWVAADTSDAVEVCEVFHRAIHQQGGRVHALLCLESLADDPDPPQPPPPIVRPDHASVLRIPTSSNPSTPSGPQVEPKTQAAVPERQGSAGAPSTQTVPVALAPSPPKGLSGLLVEQFGRHLRRRYFAAVHAVAAVAPYMQSQADGGRIVLATGWAQPLATSPEPLTNSLLLAAAGVVSAPLREQRVHISVVQPTWQTDPEATAACVVDTLRRYRFVSCASPLWGLAGGSVGNGVWGTPPSGFWALVLELFCLGVVRLTAAAALAHAKLRRKRTPPRRGAHHSPHGWA